VKRSHILFYFLVSRDGIGFGQYILMIAVHIQNQHDIQNVLTLKKFWYIYQLITLNTTRIIGLCTI